MHLKGKLLISTPCDINGSMVNFKQLVLDFFDLLKYFCINPNLMCVHIELA